MTYASRLSYFAYGSNMSLPRLAARIDSARKLSTASLDRHVLRFHKAGRDGSGKCDVHVTDDPLDAVIGVLYDIAHADRLVLDGYEGRGRGYEVKTVSVTVADGRRIEAFTYYATDVDARLRPFHWYKNHVLNGAAEHGLPHAYRAAIHGVEAVDDPDPARHAAEMAIYREPEGL